VTEVVGPGLHFIRLDEVGGDETGDYHVAALVEDLDGRPEVEPNDSVETANSSPVGMVCGSIDPAEQDDDVFAFRLRCGGDITVRADDGFGGCGTGGSSVGLRLLDSEGTELVPGSGGDGQCPLIDPDVREGAANLDAGLYHVEVTDWDNNAVVPRYYVYITASEVDAEPNDTILEAAGPFDATFAACGWTAEGGDVDLYELTVAEGADVRVETVADGVDDCPMDTIAQLLDADGLELVQDDDDGADTCSLIDPAQDAAAAELAAGTYFVAVRSYGQGAPGPYRLEVQIE
jgi:hypothetical protein